MVQATLREELQGYGIGAKLRALRLRKKLGLVELGRHTGLSPALLSKLERDKMIPTLATLLRIAMVFNVELDHFFADHRKRRVCAVIQKDVRQTFPESPDRRDPAYHFENLTFPVSEPKCHAYVATFHPVPDGAARPHEHPGIELIYVLGGELGVIVETVEHRLRAGDAMYFDSTLPHSYRRLGRLTSSALVVSIA